MRPVVSSGVHLSPVRSMPALATANTSKDLTEPLLGDPAPRDRGCSTGPEAGPAPADLLTLHSASRARRWALRAWLWLVGAGSALTWSAYTTNGDWFRSRWDEGHVLDWLVRAPQAALGFAISAGFFVSLCLLLSLRPRIPLSLAIVGPPQASRRHTSTCPAPALPHKSLGLLRSGSFVPASARRRSSRSSCSSPCSWDP